MLCKACTRLDLDAASSYGVPHHGSFDELLSAAEAGCALCAAIRDEYARHKGPPFVASDPDDSQITCTFNPLGQFLSWDQFELKGQTKIATLKVQTTYYDPMGKVLWARVVSSDVSSDEFWKLVSIWVGTCLRDHNVCRSDDAVQLPTRVIDVGTPDQDPFLFQSGRCNGEWVCLSYCWGDAPPFKTTCSNLQDRCLKILFGDMPLLFQDAIHVTRRLGYRYLWIDSLCIVQDSIEDWLAESVNMGSIFKNSAITLAAESSSDSSVGLFQSTNRGRRYHSLRIPTFSTQHEVEGFLVCGGRRYSAHSGILKGPLSKRAWTLQENLLPRRVLRFTESQVWWQCHTAQCNESDPYGSDWGSSWFYGYRFLVTRGLTQSDRISTLLSSWYDIVKEYAKRGITFEKDIFPAISGLAREVHEGIGQEYKAGIWAQDIHRGLIWFAPRPGAKRRVTPYIAPSWSWASVDFSKTEECWQQRYVPMDDIYYYEFFEPPLFDSNSSDPQAPNQQY